MSEASLSRPRRDVADYEARAAELLAEIDRVGEQIDRSRAEGERFRSEAHAIGAHTAAILSGLQEQVERLSSRD